ncbi:MAG: hypothetical protein IH840_07590 [Candidatus Heimdallarchaeota archaeon]|nr:hypothetical protein [Candidatus Heimdallarchaeota archaeon]
MLQESLAAISSIMTSLYSDDLDNALDLISRYEKTEIGQTEPLVDLEIKICKARALRQQRKFTQAYDIMQYVNQAALETKNLVLQFKAQVEFSFILNKLGLYQNLENHNHKRSYVENELDKVVALFNKLTPKDKKKLKSKIGMMYNLQGLIKYYKRQIVLSLNDFEKSFNILKQTEDVVHLGSIMVDIAYANIYLGNFSATDEILQDAINLTQRHQDKETYFWSIQAYAVLASFRGHLDSSLNLYQQCFGILDDLDRPTYAADLYGALGIIYWEKKQLGLALSHFQKCLSFPHDEVNFVTLGMSLFYSYLIHLELNELEEAQRIYDLVMTSRDNFKDPVFEIGANLVYALKLKYSSSLADKLKARDALEEMLNVAIPFNKIYVIIISNLAELFFIEYKALENEEILEKLKKLISLLEDIGRKQESTLLLIDAYHVFFKIHSLTGDNVLAEKYITDAIILAEDRNLSEVSATLTEEYDQFRKNYLIWSDNTNVGVSTPNKINSDITKTLRSIGRINQPTGLIPEPEKPIMVLLIQENGTLQFTRKYDWKITMNENLVSSFISAINAFTQNTFQSGKPIERIDYYEYTIVIRKFAKHLLTYIFTGASYHAFKKVDRIINQINNDPKLMEKINPELSQRGIHTSLQDETALGQIIDHCILDDFQD